MEIDPNGSAAEPLTAGTSHLGFVSAEFWCKFQV
jgi:hypothetical protein